MFSSKLFDRCPKTGKIRGINKSAWPKWSLLFAGLAACIWYMVRVIPKPSRAAYPCQRAAAPIRIGFLAYLVALAGWAFSFAKAKSLLRDKRRFLAGLFFVVSIVSLFAFIGSDARITFAASGTAKGIFPGRVAWVYNANAAKWTGSGNYWDASVNPQSEYNKSFTAGIEALSGASGDAAAWDAIFRYHNNNANYASNKRPGTGYQAGDKIFIKINQNNTSNPGGGTGESNANPQTCAAICRSLVNAGVPASDVYIGDPSRAVTTNISNAVHAVNSAINIADYFNNGSYSTVTLGYNLNNRVSNVVLNCRYLIDQPLMKGHNDQPTFSGKCLFGVTGLSNNSGNNGHPNSNNAWGLLMTHEKVGDKAVLWCMDAMYPNVNLNGTPSAKVNVPFLNQNTQLSSFIMSLDGAATDCVSWDFFNYIYGNKGWSDGYVQYVAQNGGGVYDRWDANHKYAKDRDPNASGIELKQVRPDLSGPGALAFSGATYSVSENGGSATITVNRTNGSTGSVSVNYATSDGTAKAGVKYTAVSGTLTFASGSSASQTFSVPVTDNAIVDGNMTFSVALSGVSGGATLGSPSTATVTIVDDDQARVSLPGRIQAEDYINGGEGVGYHDADAVNSGGQYRTDGVDIEACTDVGGGYDVGWTAAGEWLAYNVAVTTTGQYTLTARMASGVAGTKTMTVTLDGASIGAFTTTDASGWQSWKDIVVPNVNLTAGNHSLRMNMTTAGFNINYLNVAAQVPVPGALQFSAAAYTVAENGGSLVVTVNRTGGTAGAVSVNYATSDGTAKAGVKYTAVSGTLTFVDGSSASQTFSVPIIDNTVVDGNMTFNVALSGVTGGATLGSPSTATITIIDNDGVTGISLPGRIQAEDYNTGGQNVGYYDATLGNTGGAYRTDDVDIEVCTDVGGGYDVGWTAAGEWLAYNVNVATAGLYDLTARMASGIAGTKTLTVSLDGAAIGTFSTTDASGWQSWKDVQVTGVNLPAGNHALRMTMTTAGINLNYLNVAGHVTVTEIAQGKPATSSSNENATLGPSNAFDGNTTTRWSSGFSDPQWIYGNLGTTYSISQVNIQWEGASAMNYQIQVSSDAATWTTISTQTNRPAGPRTDNLTGLSGTGQYVRMYGTARNTVYGYSIYEFKVYGALITGQQASPAPVVNAKFARVDWKLSIRGFSSGAVYFTLPGANAYTLSVFGVSGARAAFRAHGDGQIGLNSASVSLPQGIYLMRLALHNGMHVDKRVRVMK